MQRYGGFINNTNYLIGKRFKIRSLHDFSTNFGLNQTFLDAKSYFFYLIFDIFEKKSYLSDVKTSTHKINYVPSHLVDHTWHHHFGSHHLFRKMAIPA